MTADGAGSDGQPGMKGARPRPVPPSEPEFDAYGIPVRPRRPRTLSGYLMGLSGLACSIVPVWVAVRHSTHRPATYQDAVGMSFVGVAMLLPLFLMVREANDTMREADDVDPRLGPPIWIGLAGAVIAFAGMLMLARAAGWSLSDAGG